MFRTNKNIVSSKFEQEHKFSGASTCLSSRYCGASASGSYTHITTSSRCATSSLIYSLSNLHDLTANSSLSSSHRGNLFNIHLAHLVVIFTWLSGNLFHIAFQGNYSLWILSPLSSIAIAHATYDTHYTLSTSAIFSPGSADVSSVSIFSGMYHLFRTWGFTTEYELFSFSLSLILLSLLCASLVLLHRGSFSGFFAGFEKKLVSSISPSFFSGVLSSAPDLRLSYHLSALLGVSSALWSLHLIFVALPVSRACPSSFSLAPLLSLSWSSYSTGVDSYSSIFGSVSSSSASLTFLGGLSSSDSLFLSDIAHHHLSLGVLLIWSSHLYSSLNASIGTRLRDLTYVSSSSTSVLHLFSSQSLDLELAISLASLGHLSFAVSQHMYSLPSYVFLSSDYVSTISLYSHHMWIGSLFVLGGFVHGSLFVVRDYSTSPSASDLLARIISTKASIIAHLSWVTLWLGFHTLYVYSHNDTVTAFGVPDCQIILEPVFAQLVQSASGSSAYGFSLSSYAANYSQAFLTLSSADFLVHHAISLGLHTTSLILLKGSLDARSSRLVPDKAALGFGFPCDGPGRGGTCDVSSWDTFYLACFWLLNLISWTLFYFHFRHLTLWQQLSSALSENGSSLMSWFRDYLWFNSAPLIRGYSLSAVSDISPWSWIFLAAHLCWAVGFMFLISWRGYWQELIDVIALMHSMSPIVGDIWDSAVFTPSALSIVQARLVGLVHFAAGLIFTYGSFVVGATS